MKKILTTLIALSIFGVTARASELSEKLDKLKAAVTEVKGAKETYNQQITYDAAKPYRVELQTVETDHKGNSTTRKAVLNLGLLDEHLVRRETSKDLMWITAGSGRMPAIKMYEDGNLDDYENELMVFCTNVDNAREVEELLKALIPMARKAWEESISLPQDLAGLQTWLKENIKAVEAGDENYKQYYQPDEGHPARAVMRIEEYGEKGLDNTESRTLNLGDLSEPTVQIEVKKDVVVIEAHTRQNLDFISVQEDGEKEGLSDEVEFYVEDVDQAQVITKALQQAIPLAREASEKRLPSPESLQAALAMLKEKTVAFAVNDKKYEQNLEGEQQATYTRRISTDKGQEEQKRNFNYADLLENSVEIKPEKELFEVKVPTAAGRSFVQAHKDGEQQSYEDEVVLLSKDLPTAKELQHLLRYIIKNSEKEIAPKDFAWLKATLAGFGEEKLEIAQAVELKDGDACKLSFTTREAGKNSVETNLYEFNLYDLDPEKIAIEVKRQEVYIQMLTNYKEEIIKNYENEGEIKYIHEIVIKAPDIPTAKDIQATLINLVGNCKKK